MITFMTRSHTKVACCCLIGLILWLLVACASTSSTPTSPSLTQNARLFTRTPTPTITPTPTLDPFVIYLDGLTERDTWDLASALDRFDTALAKAPTASLYASRAEVYRLMGKYEETAADIKMALERDPNLADAWRQKALLSRAQENWDEALDAVNRLIELEPSNGAAFALRAQIYDQGFDKILQSLVDYHRAIRLDPFFDKATLVERWHILARLGDWEEALIVSHKMATTGSQDPLRYYYRAWSLIQLGRLDEAIQILFFGLDRYPDYPVALYYALGVAYYERQAWAEAVQALDVALNQLGAAKDDMRVEISEPDILGRLGVAYLELRQCETGAALVERAIAEAADLSDWYWARERIQTCYIAITPTPTRTATPVP